MQTLEGKMIEISENVSRTVDELFAANRKLSCEIPVVGGHYIPGLDNPRRLKKLACRALAAREWFAQNGLPELPPLPVSYDEREEMRSGRGLLPYIYALFARSLESSEYDIEAHPSFEIYASGVLEAVECQHIGRLPEYPAELLELKKRFPPRRLSGLDIGFYWLRPKDRKKYASYLCEAQKRSEH
jgi:hypothetical protein